MVVGVVSASKSQYIYTLRPVRLEMLSEGPSTEEANILQQHVKYLERLAQTDKILLAGRTQTSSASTFGIVIISATTADLAEEIMAKDPAIKGDIMTGELFPYRVAVMSPGGFRAMHDS